MTSLIILAAVTLPFKPWLLPNPWTQHEEFVFLAYLTAVSERRNSCVPLMDSYSLTLCAAAHVHVSGFFCWMKRPKHKCQGQLCNAWPQGSAYPSPLLLPKRGKNKEIKYVWVVCLLSASFPGELWFFALYQLICLPWISFCVRCRCVCSLGSRCFFPSLCSLSGFQESSMGFIQTFGV